MYGMVKFKFNQNHVPVDTILPPIWVWRRFIAIFLFGEEVLLLQFNPIVPRDIRKVSTSFGKHEKLFCGVYIRLR